MRKDKKVVLRDLRKLYFVNCGCPHAEYKANLILYQLELIVNTKRNNGKLTRD